MKILSFFDRDEKTYSQDGIVAYSFHDGEKDAFVAAVRDFYRQCFISDEDLADNIAGMGTKREDEIAMFVPTDPIIKSGDFGEILSFAIFTELNPDYNVTPIRWRWKEERDRAVHFADIIIFCCPDETNPQTTDKMMTIEVKTRATRPYSDESSIINAIGGALKDSVSRAGKTLLFLQQKFRKEKNYDAAKKVMRFEDAVPVAYEEYHNAIAIVERNYLKSHHIGNLDNNTIQQVKAYNKANNPKGKWMNVFVVPIAELKALYDNLYEEVIKS